MNIFDIENNANKTNDRLDSLIKDNSISLTKKLPPVPEEETTVGQQKLTNNHLVYLNNQIAELNATVEDLRNEINNEHIRAEKAEKSCSREAKIACVISVSSLIIDVISTLIQLFF